ncbi:uncharacterized protein V1516DRAFT_617933 [Lipomyces oligophaga]|uniref:uncharacterized protein n=1 Tax=Lipomyces oligophaga TaxID=45792 RepID=UPI0034CE2AD9
MTTFSSRTVGGATKKHCCHLCNKRFTRPSSLQTHIFSHTGERPFRCDDDNCGRRFSVVSNLRRHKQVHLSGKKDKRRLSATSATSVSTSSPKSEVSSPEASVHG